MQQLTPPYINFNGNTEKQILNEFVTIYKSFDNTIELLSKTEYNNGRNATNQEHAQKMKAEKIAILQKLKEFQEMYIQLINNIND